MSTQGRLSDLQRPGEQERAPAQASTRTEIAVDLKGGKTGVVRPKAKDKPLLVRAYGAVCDPGTVRTLNEDAFLVVPERLLFGLADGLGGAGVGEVAARESLERVRYFVENGLGDSEVTLPFVYRRYYTVGGNLLFNGLLYANEQLYNENKTRQINGRGGASVLFAFVDGPHLTLASVGACSAYLYRRGKIQAVVKPRTYNALKGVYQGTWNPRWAFPLMALGNTIDVEAEILELQVQKGDVLFLATDGVYPQLREEDFIQSFSGFAPNTPLDLKIMQQNQKLIEMARERGSTDNQALITIVCE